MVNARWVTVLAVSAAAAILTLNAILLRTIL